MFFSKTLNKKIILANIFQPFIDPWADYFQDWRSNEMQVLIEAEIDHCTLQINLEKEQT